MQISNLAKELAESMQSYSNKLHRMDRLNETLKIKRQETDYSDDER